MKSIIAYTSLFTDLIACWQKSQFINRWVQFFSCSLKCCLWIDFSHPACWHVTSMCLQLGIWSYEI